MSLRYDLDKIKFSTDRPTFERAIGLYEHKKVTKFKRETHGCSAVVVGSHPYDVYVSNAQFDRGTCTCYLGQEEVLCKHMVAVALYAVKNGTALAEEDTRIVDAPKYSGQMGELPKVEHAELKKLITASLRYIKPYSGPSRTWFAYQNSLQEGCNRLSKIVSDLPVSRQTAKVLVDLLLRLDDKLCRGGVDDSDGTVGNFIIETAAVLQEFVQLDPVCKEELRTLKGRETCFDWEEPLVKLLGK